MSHTTTTEHPFAPFMYYALHLAERGRWHTAPNPTVGAVLVAHGEVVAEGWHKAYGGPHAEIECLCDAEAKGVDSSACTMVVTLEPCNHFGKTPPCSRAIEAAGIKHVIVGLADPNPVAMGGAEYLRSRGVHVEILSLEEMGTPHGIPSDTPTNSAHSPNTDKHPCHAQIADFLAWKMEQRPYLVLKLASTLDGRIATRMGHSQWISGPEARAKVHALRAHMALAGTTWNAGKIETGEREASYPSTGGAVLIGGQTLRDDNPQLTARLAYTQADHDGQSYPQPLAIVVSQRLPEHGALPRLIQERPEYCIFLTSEEAAQSASAIYLQSLGVRILALPKLDGVKLDLAHGLRLLHARYGILYILCEGGGQLGLSLLESNLVDEFQLHLAPKILGDAEARPLFAGRSPLVMAEALQLRMASMEACGNDCIITFKK